MITAEQIRAIAGPAAKFELVNAIVNGWPTAVRKADLTTAKRAAHFLAQIMTETGGLRILEESGAYSASRIMQIFGVGHHSAGITEQEAQRIASLPVAQRGPVLFNRVYGRGNPVKMREFKNTGPNDGWLYRGGGMMQATGKSNYAALGKKTGLPLVEHPELLHQPDSAFTAAYLEWAQDGRCNAAADRDDVVAVRKIINGGKNGLTECRKYLAKAKEVLADYDVEVAAVEPAPEPELPAARPMSTSKIGNSQIAIGTGGLIEGATAVTDAMSKAKEVKQGATDLGVGDVLSHLVTMPSFWIAVAIIAVAGAAWYWRREHAQAGV